MAVHTTRAALVAAARRATRYSRGRLRTASTSRLTAPKLPDRRTAPGIGESAELLPRVDEPRRGVAVLMRVHPRVEIRDPAGPGGGQRRYVAQLGDDLVGGAQQRPGRGLLEREQEPTDAGRVVLEVRHQEHHRPPRLRVVEPERGVVEHRDV